MSVGQTLHKLQVEVDWKAGHGWGLEWGPSREGAAQTAGVLLLHPSRSAVGPIGWEGLTGRGQVAAAPDKGRMGKAFPALAGEEDPVGKGVNMVREERQWKLICF